MPDLEPIPGGVRWWACDGCGKRGPWGPGWRWLGRYEDVDGAEPEKILCPECPDEPGGLPYFDA